MFILKILLGALVGYGVITLAAWAFQDRLAFPAPRGAVPEPKTVGVAGERVTTTLPDGTRLVGWYLPPAHAGPAPAVLWLYGNAENLSLIWPVLREFKPPDAGLLALDYPGYGESGGRSSEAGLYETAEAGYDWLRARADVDAARIVVYGRSIGSAGAVWLAARAPVAGLVLDSPFTSAGAMARRHFAVLPRFILRLRLDNLALIARVRCPVLVFHGTKDRLAPPDMGAQLAAAAPRGSELVLIAGAGHNETYDVGDEEYRAKLAAFVARVRSP